MAARRLGFSDIWPAEAEEAENYAYAVALQNGGNESLHLVEDGQVFRSVGKNAAFIRPP
jgi:hypothetical protein